MFDWRGDTPLTDLNIPCFPVLLQEKFSRLWSEDSAPKTIQELSEWLSMPLEDMHQRLRELVKITSSIVITESEMVTLVSQGAVLLNIASSGKDFDWYFEQFKATNITPDIQKIEELWFEDFIQEHKSLKTHIITFSDRLSEAVSGACFLRNVGLKSQSFAINQ